MSERTLFKLYSTFLVVILVIGCKTNEPQWFALEGETMGSTYHIQYLGHKNYQKEIDRLLEEINDAVSTYIPTSTISVFNSTGYLAIPLAENGEPKNVLHKHFFANLEEAYEIFELSNGYFDPTVGPLVEIWGFGKGGHQSVVPDSSDIDSLLMSIGMQHLEVRSDSDTIYIKTLHTGLSIDFSALAQGYATDKVFELLSGRGSKDIFTEITGEVRVTGKSPRGDAWIVGINVPEEGAGLQEIGARIRLNDASMATSGNYRNFYMLEGRKVWHTINPKTGYPEENSLLSATIVHHRCITADGLATACMAMGVDEAIGLVRKVPAARAYFIYRDVSGNIATFVSDKLTNDLLIQ
jgi:thiamine biosynthesis lipoprotein